MAKTRDLEKRISRKTVQLASRALLEKDAISLTKLSMAMSILAVASSLTEASDIDRLLKTAESIARLSVKE